MLKLRCKEAMIKDMEEEKKRAQETFKSVQAEMKKEPADVDAVSRNKTYQRGDKNWNQRTGTKPKFLPEENHANKPAKQQGCKCCGGQHAWGRSNCPARNINCHNCQRMGHFAKVCFKSVKEVVLTEKEDDSGSEEDYYTLSILSEVTSRGEEDEEWRAEWDLETK
jgi:hypothetical protein